MVIMSDWEQFESDTENAPISQKIEELKERKRKQEDNAKAIEKLEADLVAEFPEEFGEQTRVYGKDVVTINRQERFHWDQDILEELFKSGKLPAHIKKRLTVEKRTFQKLTETEQKELQPALTRKPGPISVKLTRSS
tara:strand:- start:15392 stop:15802 length:411 start_codon:yes stop_codon:yes gene_type:complete